MRYEYKLIIQNRQGVVMEMSDLVGSITITLNRTGSPGKMEFTWRKVPGTSFNEGDSVLFTVNGRTIFFGYIFTKEKDRWHNFRVTCYDQIRYLKANRSYVFTGMTTGAIIKKIVNDLNADTSPARPRLKAGVIDDTGYRIPSLIFENKTCLDMISRAVEETLLNTGKFYVFYDSAGSLNLQQSNNIRHHELIGVGSRATDYTYKTDIDKDTYNHIKLVRPNEETGRGDVYIHKDSDNINKWGLLSLYEVVDENMNPAQINAKAETMLEYYNRTMRNISFSKCLGVLGLRAGAMIMVDIPDLGDIALNQSWMLVDKVTHYFENDLHTMDFESRIWYPK